MNLIRTNAERAAVIVTVVLALFLLAQIASNTATPPPTQCMQVTPNGVVPCPQS
jgi:hypothetical protein